MEPVATTSADYNEPSESTKSTLKTETEPGNLRTNKYHGGIFECSICALEERYDYKGAKPPFARAIAYSEDCYIAKDPFSLPNKGEVLVLGADCSVCQKPICLGCSLFYVKRFCRSCAIENISRLPNQLQSKINHLKNIEAK